MKHQPPRDSGDNPWSKREPAAKPNRPRHSSRAGGESSQQPAQVEHTPKMKEQRLYGFNACMAMFGKRPQDLRKVYLLESRIPHLQPVLAYCVQQRRGYRVVNEEDLHKLTQTGHHEGLCFDVLPRAELSLTNWLAALPAGPQLAIWLDGVGNPHNFGAILRSAAHFGAAVFLPQYDPLALSGAAARVAEGGAEMVSLVRLGHSDKAIAQLRAAGFELAATVVRSGESVFKSTMPQRLVLLMGAEQTGVDRELLKGIPKRLLIPGTGDVDSLNVSAATAVFLAQWAARQ